MKFQDITYNRPALSRLTDELGRIREEIVRAPDGETLADLYRKQCGVLDEYYRNMVIASIRYTQDTRDLFWASEQQWFDENNPKVDLSERENAKAFLENNSRDALEAAFGTMILPTMRNKVLAGDALVLELQQEENALSSAYQKLCGSALVEFDGKTLTLPQLAPYKESLDGSVRRAAYEAEAGYYDAHRAEFDEIYDKMVKNRNQQAKILGYDDYSQLSYVRMNRVGYGAEEVKAFRDEIVRHVVPMIEKLMKLRAERVGIAHPMFWDSAVSFADGNPVPHGTYDELMEGARTMYHELSPETAEFIDQMMENEMFDVLSRPGKMGGGYCESIPGLATPFIFANWNGTAGDMDVLTHEAGHGLEVYLATKAGLPRDLQWGGMESCEIHSMSMEFLTSPWHHLFFGPDTDKYELLHAEDSLFFLPYGCMVDEFQHIVYRQPDLTPEERNQAWLSLERKYRPWNDFGGLPFYSRGAGWQRQLHIYECPFYYIDYCLAAAISLQFFAAHLKDPKDAWQRYLKLTRLAGTASYAELAGTAGMEVPFTKGSLAAVAETVGRWIEEKQVVTKN